MRFRVSRTSEWDETVRPCEEAEAGTAQVWDRRTFSSPEAHDAKLGPGTLVDNPAWVDRGTEHGRWGDGKDGGIQRRLADKTAWFVELDSLDALLAFGDKHGGQLVVSREYDVTPTLEIYDTWRE